MLVCEMVFVQSLIHIYFALQLRQSRVFFVVVTFFAFFIAVK